MNREMDELPNDRFEGSESAAELTRARTLQVIAPSQLWQAIDDSIEELGSGDRCVEYSIDSTPRSHEDVSAWLANQLARGPATIRYVIDTDVEMIVRINLTTPVR